jgi:hypothetical protein
MAVPPAAPGGCLIGRQDMAQGIGLGGSQAAIGRPVEAAFHWFRRVCRVGVAYPLLAAATAGYSLVAFELSLAHARPMPEPYLRIPDQDYFLWGTFFYAPVIVCAWLLAASAIYVICSLIGVKPAFDRLLMAIALASGLGTLGTLIPDLITSPLRATGVIEERAWELSIATQGPWFVFTWATLITYLLLFAIGYSFAVKLATSARWSRAIAVGLAGFIVFQGFEYLFIR